MVGVFFVFRLEGDVEVAIVFRPLAHCCSCVGFACRGAVTTGGWSPDNDLSGTVVPPGRADLLESGLYEIPPAGALTKEPVAERLLVV
ncbi:hypothetical protein BHE74_00016602 [Ensete ventricosum]|nr:hypothetical protein BHE74_00016602 [Ensete ventricosum]